MTAYPLQLSLSICEPCRCRIFIGACKSREVLTGVARGRYCCEPFARHTPILAEFTEVEAAKKSHAANRPQLIAAIEEAKRRSATLLIAKLDRLARNVYFISGLMESGVDFVAADMPQANRLTVHIMAALAEHEARAISERTKAALAALKARGVQLGNPRWAESLDKARKARIGQIPQVPPPVIEMIHRMRLEGGTLRAIAARLNALGSRTPRGGKWHATSVRSALALSDAPIHHPRPKPFCATEVLAALREHRETGKSLREIAAAMNALAIKTPTGAQWHASSVRAALLGA